MEKRAEISAKVDEWGRDGIGVICDIDFCNTSLSDITALLTSVILYISTDIGVSAEEILDDIGETLKNSGITEVGI